MAKRLIKRVWWPRVWIPLLLALALLKTAALMEERAATNFSNGWRLHELAFEMLDQGNYEAAYQLFQESAVYSDDPALRAVSLYDAANVGWGAELTDYATLVALYQESLRNFPGFGPASWNLEYLYLLRSQAPELLPEPGNGQLPGEQDYVPTGDI